jgi:hypothetical protein
LRANAADRDAGAPLFFALVNDADRMYFGGGAESGDQFGYIEPGKQAVFGRSYAAEPEVLIEQLKKDQASPPPTRCS